jgi:hypothetical protein
MQPQFPIQLSNSPFSRSIVIASRRVGAKRRPMTGSAKQSISQHKESMDCFVAFAPLCKRFAFVAGNDGHTSAFPRRVTPE